MCCENFKHLVSEASEVLIEQQMNFPDHLTTVPTVEPTPRNFLYQGMAASSDAPELGALATQLYNIHCESESRNNMRK
jgi:hypothetical protein